MNLRPKLVVRPPASWFALLSAYADVTCQLVTEEPVAEVALKLMAFVMF